MAKKARSEFREIVEAAEKAGWAVEMTKGSHWCFKSPDPKVPLFFTGGTPSDARWINNVRGDLRRRGLNI